mmetsp:Transcript_11735/g.37606  ORF Transcript_11735/g.37606 Transcript_11735/m.37606 type:complete len:207 (-) Transcript_11735:511-1131(-)
MLSSAGEQAPAPPSATASSGAAPDGSTAISVTTSVAIASPVSPKSAAAPVSAASPAGGGGNAAPTAVSPAAAAPAAEAEGCDSAARIALMKCSAVQRTCDDRPESSHSLTHSARWCSIQRRGRDERTQRESSARMHEIVACLYRMLFEMTWRSRCSAQSMRHAASESARSTTWQNVVRYGPSCSLSIVSIPDRMTCSAVSVASRDS